MELRKEFCKEFDVPSVMAFRQDYAGGNSYEDGFCDEYVEWLEKKLGDINKSKEEPVQVSPEAINILSSWVKYDRTSKDKIKIFGGK